MFLHIAQGFLDDPKEKDFRPGKQDPLITRDREVRRDMRIGLDRLEASNLGDLRR